MVSSIHAHVLAHDQQGAVIVRELRIEVKPPALTKSMDFLSPLREGDVDAVAVADLFFNYGSLFRRSPWRVLCRA